MRFFCVSEALLALLCLIYGANSEGDSDIFAASIFSIPALLGNATTEYGELLRKFPSIENMVGNASTKGEGKELNLDPWIDGWFKEYKAFMKKYGFDVSPAPDLAFNFEWKVLWMITLIHFGHAGWKTGQIRGLETIHRVGPSSLEIVKGNDTNYAKNGALNVSAKFGVDYLSVRYSGEVQVVGFDMLAKVNLTSIFKSLDIDFVGTRDHNCVYSIEKLDVIPGNVTTKVTEMVIGPLQDAIQYMADTGTALLKDKIAYVIKSIIQNTFMSAIMKDLKTKCERMP